MGKNRNFLKKYTILCLYVVEKISNRTSVNKIASIEKLKQDKVLNRFYVTLYVKSSTNRIYYKNKSKKKGSKIAYCIFRKPAFCGNRARKTAL